METVEGPEKSISRFFWLLKGMAALAANVLLLIGGDKSTQARDIRKAKELARKYSE